jgi:glycosyltransferase involved in cell wall biosynthesis
MRVTLIVNYSDKRISGGPQGVAYDTVEGLKKNHQRLEKEDIHIHVMSSLGSRHRSEFRSEENLGNISYEYFSKIVPTAVFSDLNYYLHIRKHKKSTDLLHSHPISGATAGTFLKIPTLFTLHGMYWKEMQYDPGLYSKIAYGELNVRRFRYVARHVKKLIAISPYVITEVGRFLKTGIPPGEVIENPVSDKFFGQKKCEQEGLIIYPASISPLKNQCALVEALYRLKQDNIPFQCILPGPVADPGYFKTLEALIHKRGLEKDVTLPGPASLDQMLALYARASVMVMTSRQETAPLVISEAMATATPVIASRISGIPYMVSEGNSGLLVNPDDPGDIAGSIRTVLDDASLRKRWGKESGAIAASRWKSDVITGRLLDLYLQQEKT